MRQKERSRRIALSYLKDKYKTILAYVFIVAVFFMVAFLYGYEQIYVDMLYAVVLALFFGGAYESICSVFTEIIFGKVFWDYSEMQFNLGGRINLLYCFFWGIAAVVWIKGIYPVMARFIDIILKKTGRLLTVFLILFMAMDVCVSVMALIRYDTRSGGQEAVYKWEQSMDKYFGDARMERIYPNAIQK